MSASVPLIVPGFDMAGTSLYRARLGGDYYDFLRPAGGGDGRLAVAVGDVAGHDAIAGGLMRIVRACLRAQPAQPGRLGALMEGINRDFSGRVAAGRFMTLFLAVLVAGTRNIHWVSAGHGPAMAYDPAADRFDEVQGLDIPLGIDPQWRYHELAHSGWSPGTLLVVGTDGITEARNRSGDMYGRDRLCDVVRASASACADDIMRAVTTDVGAFRQGRPAQDDLTIVVVKAV